MGADLSIQPSSCVPSLWRAVLLAGFKTAADKNEKDVRNNKGNAVSDCTKRGCNGATCAKTAAVNGDGQMKNSPRMHCKP